MLLITLLIIAQLIVSVAVWIKWRGTREKLASKHHELSRAEGV